MENSIILSNGIDSEILEKLSSYSDFLNAYIQIDQTANGVSWMKADILSTMEQRLGDASLKELSKELGENYSTLVSYIRVSRAFPIDRRDEKASFSLHFQASFADKYNSESKNFSGEERFAWIDKAVDENLSSRSLARAIHGEVEEKKTAVDDRSYVMKVAETIRRKLATIVRMADGGDSRSEGLLNQILSMLKEY